MSDTPRTDALYAQMASTCDTPGDALMLQRMGHLARTLERELAQVTPPAAPQSPKFPKTYCSQCGGEFGPGDGGYSHCRDHAAMGAERGKE